jgi:hypothetical protein
VQKNNLAEVVPSSGKQHSNEKTYRIPISTGIFDHYSAIGDALWLFLWYIDKTTTEGDSKGFVLGGCPIADSKPAGVFGVPVKTARRWRERLTMGVYIEAIRTPYGHRITVKKSKKKWLSVPTNSPRENSRGGKSEFPQREERIPVAGIENSRSGKYKEDIAVQSRDEAVEERPAAPTAEVLVQTPNRKIQAWEEIKLQPLGSLAFVRIWERVWEEMPNGEGFEFGMERAIQLCQDRGIKVPPPFYEAKRKIEQQNAEPPKQFGSSVSVLEDRW